MTATYAEALAHLNPVVEVPQQLVLEVAVGLDTFVEICARYGIDEEDAALLKENRLFQRQVRQAEAELKKDGTTFRMRAAHAAEDLLGDIWKKSVQPEVPLVQKLEAFRVLVKMADLEPKPSALPAGGSGFSVTISIPGSTTTITAGAPAPAAQPAFVPITEDSVLEMEPARSRNQDLALPADWED